MQTADPLKCLIKTKNVIFIEQPIKPKDIMWVLQCDKRVGPPSENESDSHQCINGISDVDS